MNTPGADRACPHGHDGPGTLAGELRALALLALDRLEPLLARLTDAAAGAPEPGSVDGPRPCPVCAVLAAVRAERPESAARLARQATELAAALREALSDGPPAAADAGPAARPVRRVERIPVDRPARTAGATPC